MHKMESSILEKDSNLNWVLDAANRVFQMHVFHSENKTIKVFILEKKKQPANPTPQFFLKAVALCCVEGTRIFSIQWILNPNPC